MTGAPAPSLAAGAVAVLEAAAPDEKVALALCVAAAWRAGALAAGSAAPPDRPGRPARPALLPPREMPKRRAAGSPASRIALLHALAHIELNAIDLAFDVVARFGADRTPDFLDDWVRVGAEEAGHFALLAARLAELGAGYGDLPAHDGLWQAAEATRHDLLARLAVVPLVLEARGLDVTPETVARLERQGDVASAGILQRIYADEIGHVAIGRRWFEAEAAARGLDPVPTWQALVRAHFKGSLKPPFNLEARDAAGFPSRYFAPLAA